MLDEWGYIHACSGGSVQGTELGISVLIIPNYSIFRLDRSRRGGGILVYVKSSLCVSSVQSPLDIELLFLTVKSNHRFFSIATFYRPPSSPHDIDLLLNAFSKLDPSLLLNLILVGDFNINFANSNSALIHKLHSLF